MTWRWIVARELLHLWMVAMAGMLHSREQLGWYAPGSLILPEGSGGSRAVLIEKGLVAVSVAAAGAPAACVALLGPGTLLRAMDGTAHVAIVPVTARELPIALLHHSMERMPRLRDLLCMQNQQRLAQTQTIAACNAQHPLAQRCVRWLMRLRAMTGDDIPITHEILARLMSVRRAGISVTLETLQREGVVRQLRGRILVLDRERLACRACVCENGVADAAGAISADMLQPATPNDDQPRLWIEQQLGARQLDVEVDDQTWARRQAVLLVCRAILARGRSILGSAPMIPPLPPPAMLTPEAS